MIAIFRQLIYEKHFVGVPHFETNEYKKFISPSLSSFFSYWKLSDIQNGTQQKRDHYLNLAQCHYLTTPLNKQKYFTIF